MRLLSVATAAQLLLFGMIAPANIGWGTTISFDQPSDLDGFSKRNDHQFLPFQWQAVGGVGNSGSVGSFGNANSSTYFQSVEMSDVGDRIELSAHFNTGDFATLSSTQSQTLGEVYLSDNASGYPFQDANVALLFFDRTFANDRLWGLPMGPFGGSSPGFALDFPTGTIKAYTWYQLHVMFTHLPMEMIMWDVEVRDFGADGLTPGGVAIEAHRQTPDPRGLTNKASLYGGLSVGLAGDNFSITALPVPEPGAAVLLLAATLVAAVRRRSPANCVTDASVSPQERLIEGGGAEAST